jgi:hypothetical protein
MNSLLANQNDIFFSPKNMYVSSKVESRGQVCFFKKKKKRPSLFLQKKKKEAKFVCTTEEKKNGRKI